MASFNCRATAGSLRGGFAARRLAARPRLRNLFDLPGDRIQPLVDVRDVAAFLAGHRRPLIVGRTKVGRGGIAEGGIEPVAQRHAGPARGGLGPAPGRMDRCLQYSTIRANSCFRPVPTSAPHLRLQPPRASRSRDNRIPRRSSASDARLFRVTVNNGLRNWRRAALKFASGRNRRGLGEAPEPGIEPSDARPIRVVALAVLGSRRHWSGRAGRQSRQGIERLFAPLHHRRS